jgi:hypothetical protein
MTNTLNPINPEANYKEELDAFGVEFIDGNLGSVK